MTSYLTSATALTIARPAILIATIVLYSAPCWLQYSAMTLPVPLKLLFSTGGGSGAAEQVQGAALFRLQKLQNYDI